MEPEEIMRKIGAYLTSSELKNKYQHMASVKGYVILDFSDIIKVDTELADNLLDDSDQVLTGFRSVLEVPILVNEVKTLTQLRDIREGSNNQIVTVEVGLRQKSGVMPRRRAIKFACNNCGREEVLSQEHSKTVYPSICICAKKKFRIIEEYFEDYCKLNVEELPENTAALQPTKMRVIAKEPLTNTEFNDKYSPGDRVYIVGRVRQEQVYVSGKPSNTFKRYIEALYIKQLEEKADDTITEEDKSQIQKIAESPLAQKLEYIAPSVVGHDRIKEALLLQLVGGVKKERELAVHREYINVLLCGEPSCAKSIIGKSIIPLKPRARYVGGSKGASSVGITAAVVKDEDGNFMLDCGSIVLANGSLLVIDEFEKMDPRAIEPLHEALEMGTISVDKAGVHATMQARTAVLAIANPKFGRWDNSKPLIDQVNLVPSLLSRFDLIFAVKDNLDPVQDTKICSKILSSAEHKEFLDTRDYGLFRKFIIYANNTAPVLTAAAAKLLQNFFVNTRKKYQEQEDRKVPITFRQLEGLIRFTEAYAKLRLANRATKEDAEQAIGLMKYYLAELGINLDTMTAEIDDLELASTRSKADLVLDQIPEKEIVETDDVIKACLLGGLDKRETETMIEKLKRCGEIYEPMGGFLKRL